MATRSRFVRPDTVTLTLSNGDTLTVKRRLNAGEHRAHLARLLLRDADGNLVRGKDDRFLLDPEAVGIATVEAYLVDWSLRDDDDRAVVIRGRPVTAVRAILDALDPADFTEIRLAVEAHAEAMDLERAAEKNAPDGENGSSATSPSRFTAAGDTSGLPN